MYDNMIIQSESTVPPRKQLTAIQARGQVTIPATIRRKLELKTGDLVAFIETDQGVMLSPQGVVGMEALDKIGTLLRDKGVDLDELIASGRDIRGDLVKERHGLANNTPLPGSPSVASGVGGVILGQTNEVSADPGIQRSHSLDPVSIRQLADGMTEQIAAST